MILIPGYTELEYDADKDAYNIEEHEYSLECAIDVLTDIMILQSNYIVSDEYMEKNEPRFMVIGDYEGKIVLIVCTLRNEGKTVRAISMRPANKKEREIFESNPPGFDISAFLDD